MAFVYILRSLKSNTYYIGSTKDIIRRFRQHNSGNVFSTKYKRPFELVFSQEYQTIQQACKIEKKIKNWKRKDFIEKIIKDGYIKYMGL